MTDTERHLTNLTILTEGLYLYLDVDGVEWTEPEYYHQN